MSDINAVYLQYVLPFIWKFLSALCIFLVGQWGARVLSGFLAGIMIRSKVNASLVIFARNVSFYALWLFVAIAALNKLGVETTSFVALVGAAGLAVGLALQGALSNFAAGVMILIFQPFGIGDTVEAGGAFGEVKEIQMFNTVFHGADSKLIIVPNAKITADKIIVHNKV